MEPQDDGIAGAGRGDCVANDDEAYAAMEGRGPLPVELDLELGIVVGSGGEEKANDDEDDDEQRYDDEYCSGGMRRRLRATEGGGESDDDYDDDVDDDDDCDYDDNDRDDDVIDIDASEGRGSSFSVDDDDDDPEDGDPEDDPEDEEDTPSVANDVAVAVAVAEEERPFERRQVPSLLRLATIAVASELEGFPPGSLGALSESHWEGVVRCRVASRRGGGGRRRRGRNDDGGEGRGGGGCGGGRMSHITMTMPAVSEKALVAIERHPNNVHLSESKVSDDLLWRDIVDRAYREGGMNRPRSLEAPCEVVKERLRNLGVELSGLVAPPIGMEEYARECERRRGSSNRKKGRIRVGGEKYTEDDGDDDDDDEEVEKKTKSDSPFDEEEETPDGILLEAANDNYRRDMAMQTERRTIALRRVFYSLRRSPMDVTMLSETAIGKCVSEAARVLKKLTRQIERGDRSDGDVEELLRGYPRFWKPVNWGQDGRFDVGRFDVRNSLALSADRPRSKGGEEESPVTPLVLLQQILQGWKDMASENDNNETVRPSSSNPSPLPSKKRKIEDEGPSSSRPRIAVATCGRGKNVSAAQHLIDMQLLHSSPTWRSLYQSLRAREAAVKKSHGDRVRSTREKLEKDRPKIGKVVIRTAAAGRVRGDYDHDGRGRSECPPAGGGGGDVHGRVKNGGIDARVQRREAILSKSLGHRARRQQLAKTSSSSSASGGGGALARIRTESKVASSWSKSSFGDASGGCARKSSFGASVAGAAGGARNGGGGGSREKKNRGNSIRVPLGNGRSMTLPSSASFFAGGGTGKKASSAGGAAVSSLPRLKEKGTHGAFSSLEEKEKKRRRLQQLGTKSIAAMGTRKR